MLSIMSKLAPHSTSPKLFRSLQNKAILRPVPPIRGQITTANDLLKAIGRSSEEKLKVDNWDELWQMNGLKLKSNGLAVKERKYILWALQQYRLGKDPSTFAYPPTPKKTIRGWGPSVQNGKVIRSRRHQRCR